jgi:glycogen debranching enzyme
MGPFLTAYARLKGGREPARWLAAIEEQFHTGCLGQVGEVFDGDAPHAPGGCVAQAWSVAELLRAAVALSVDQVHAPAPGHRGGGTAEEDLRRDA